jgi:4-hydroxybenzoate polyprenyltransferase
MLHYFEAARVGSWIGWIFNFGFGSVLFGALPFERTIIVLFAFLLATASVFVLNQYIDREEDQKNEVKSKLPVASGRITPRRTLMFFFSLVISSLILVFIANANVLLLFIIYLGLSTAYSAPPLRLKSVPIVDVIVSGIGAGFLPFIMGSGLNDNLIPNIPIIMMSATPLILIHCGTHIFQAVGDYEVDRKNGVRTFVVKYGRKKGTIVAGLMFANNLIQTFNRIFNTRTPFSTNYHPL